jgi:hypothetical protein
MLKIKERIQYYLDKDYFNIGDAGISKVHRINKLLLIGGGTLIIIILFYLILNLSTNYHKLGNFEDYVEEFKDREYVSLFEKINVGIKIMPSYNLEQNVLYMRHSRDVSKII